MEEMREKKTEIKIMQKSVSANALTLLIQAPGEFRPLLLFLWVFFDVVHGKMI